MIDTATAPWAICDKAAVVGSLPAGDDGNSAHEALDMWVRIDRSRPPR